MYRVHAGNGGGHQRVSGLVVGHDFTLLGAHHALLLEAGNQPVDRLIEVVHVDRRLVLPRSEQCRFVDEIGEVSTGKASRPCRDRPEVHGRGELDPLCVNHKHGLAALHIRFVDQHLPVKASGSKQRRVEHLRAVGGRHDDDGFVRIEAVHFSQELVQRLLAFLMGAHGALHAGPAKCVEFVDEDDAGGLGFGLCEQVAHARRADADEHLHEFRSAQAEEGDLGLAGHRAGEQRLAGAGRADEQHALGNAAAERRVLLGVAQELHDFPEFLLRFVDARDVGEADLHVVV